MPTAKKDAAAAPASPESDVAAAPNKRHGVPICDPGFSNPTAGAVRPTQVGVAARMQNLINRWHWER